MNVRKRGLALLMCICMIFTLLPFSALADNGTGEVLAVEPSSDPISMLRIYNVEIEDNIAEKGHLTLKALDRDNNEVPAAVLKEAGCTITWRRDNVPVNRIKVTGNKYNMAEDGSWVNVAYDQGAQATYTVTVSEEETGSALTSSPMKVDWYDELQNPSFEQPTVKTVSDKSRCTVWPDVDGTAAIQFIKQEDVPGWKTTVNTACKVTEQYTNEITDYGTAHWIEIANIISKNDFTINSVIAIFYIKYQKECKKNTISYDFLASFLNSLYVHTPPLDLIVPVLQSILLMARDSNVIIFLVHNHFIQY